MATSKCKADVVRRREGTEVVSHIQQRGCASSVSGCVPVSAQKDGSSQWHSWGRGFALINNNICAFNCSVIAVNIVRQP